MFKKRAHTKELLDGEVPEKDLIINLKELDTINKLLGGYSISLNAFKKVDLEKKNLVDIGSGGGDMLHEIHLYAKKRGINCQLYGIDLKKICTSYAQSHLPQSLTFITDDYRNSAKHLDKIDIIHACLFTHHLSDDEIIELIRYSLKEQCILIVNDLERNPVAYYLISFLTRIFSKSHLLKNDAPLSVLRGFKKKEWVKYLELAGANRYSVRWKWAFRHQIIVYG